MSQLIGGLFRVIEYYKKFKMGGKKNMLVGIAFSKQSMLILEEACVFAKAANSGITLLYVNSPKGIFDSSSDADRNVARTAIEEKLEDLARSTTKKTGLDVVTKIVEGKVYDKIIEVSNKLGVDLVFMGTNQESGMKGFIGSNALKVVRGTYCPVITINKEVEPHNCDVIVVPLDLTKETREKVSNAIQYAKYFDSTLKIVSVLESDEEEVVKKLMNQLRIEKGFIEEKGVNCTAEVIKVSSSNEKFSKVIIDYSKKNNADLIMIMTQQENEITEFFIGSSAQQIINNSEIPVMSIVPSPTRSGLISNNF
ncbi:MAG: universal stress protein [Flavobacteriales bacterium]|nr:universal stress protein [Flavobacteriales bacterium]